MDELIKDKNEKFQKKMSKDYPDFVDAMEGLSATDLEGNLCLYSKYNQDTQVAKENDVDLNAAKEKVSELSGPYNDALKALKMKLKYINMLINELKGTDPTEKDVDEEA